MIVDEFTSSLITFNGDDESTTFTDETAKVWVAKGNAKIDTGDSISGDSSGLFYGVGDYIETDDSADFYYDGDFTLEAFIKLDSLAGASGAYIFGQINSGFSVATGGVFLLLGGDSSLTGFFGSGASLVITADTSPLTVGPWYHVAYSREGSALRVFVDGDLKASTTSALIPNNSSSKPAIGRPGEYNGAYFKGRINLFRATKGLARYTENFDVSDVLFPVKVINGTIAETLAVVKWLVRSYRLDNGQLTASLETEDGTYSLGIPNDKSVPQLVTISADQGSKWSASKTLIIADLNYPTDPIATPYYFKVTIAGTTGSTEPTWDARPGYTTTDGTVTWECVERLVQPITHGPLIPQ